MQVLVTGTTGFIGGSLAPLLLDRGHEVVALVRNPDRLPAELKSRVTVVEGSAEDPVAMQQAMAGCDVFVWLLHSMEPAADGIGFAEREALTIQLALDAAKEAGVKRGVYLGGIAPEGVTSEHLGSRLDVEERLLEALPDSTALRASIVIGSGSRSFRFLVRLVERMPALPMPAWRDFKTQAADVRDVVAALAAAVEGAALGQSVDVASPEVITYGELIELIAERMMVSRPKVKLPFSLNAIAGQVAAAVAGEQPELIIPLMGSLGVDLLPRDDGLARLGIRAHSLESAVDRALAEWEETEELAAR
jgi:uncharacterized protein YbjT (DUF2867 family)